MGLSGKKEKDGNEGNEGDTTVLKRLLQTLQGGGTHTVAELARELGVSEALVELMIEDLVRMGHLAVATGSCGGRCAGCSLAKACAIGGSSRIWTLTEKAAQKMQNAERGHRADR